MPERSYREALKSEDLNDMDKVIISWQYRLDGDFYIALWETIARADESNLAKLELAFPLQVKAYRAWAYSDPYNMGAKLREWGLIGI